MGGLQDKPVLMPVLVEMADGAYVGWVNRLSDYTAYSGVALSWA